MEAFAGTHTRAARRHWRAGWGGTGAPAAKKYTPGRILWIQFVAKHCLKTVLRIVFHVFAIQVLPPVNAECSGLVYILYHSIF